jgi:hypothetical protein
VGPGPNEAAGNPIKQFSQVSSPISIGLSFPAMLIQAREDQPRLAAATTSAFRP